MNRNDFRTLLDQTGLPLSEPQITALFEAYPMFQALIARATRRCRAKPNPLSSSTQR